MLDGYLDVAEVVLFKKRAFPEGGLNERLWRCLAVLLQQPRIERSSVDTDADRYGRRAGGSSNLAHLVIELLDVAWVDPHTSTTRIDGSKHILGLEVDVGNNGDLRLLRDGGERIGVVLAGTGHSNDLTSRRSEL